MNRMEFPQEAGKHNKRLALEEELFTVSWLSMDGKGPARVLHTEEGYSLVPQRGLLRLHGVRMGGGEQGEQAPASERSLLLGAPDRSTRAPRHSPKPSVHPNAQTRTHKEHPRSEKMLEILQTIGVTFILCHP